MTSTFWVGGHYGYAVANALLICLPVLLVASI